MGLRYCCGASQKCGKKRRFLAKNGRFLDKKRRFLAENDDFGPQQNICLPIELISLGPRERENKFQ